MHLLQWLISTYAPISLRRSLAESLASWDTWGLLTVLCDVSSMNIQEAMGDLTL